MTTGSNIHVNGNSAIYAEVMLKLSLLTDDDKKNLYEFLNPNTLTYYKRNWIEERWGFNKLIRLGFIDKEEAREKARVEITNSEGTRTEYQKRYKYRLGKHGIYLRDMINHA